MPSNELTVIRADGATRTLRSEDLQDAGHHAQVVLVSEAPEAPVNPAGGATRHTVDSDPAVALDAPNSLVRTARVRVYESAGPANPARRLYYRTDGTNPLSDGSNAFGFLSHGDVFIVRLDLPENFRMIADSTDNGVFQIYVEWLTIPPTSQG